MLMVDVETLVARGDTVWPRLHRYRRAGGAGPGPAPARARGHHVQAGGREPGGAYRARLARPVPGDQRALAALSHSALLRGHGQRWRRTARAARYSPTTRASRCVLPAEGLPFRSSEIVAPSLRPRARSTFVVHAMFMQHEVLGHACFQLGPTDGAIFKTLGALMSSAFKASQLSRALIEEVTRRERAERARMRQELEIAARIQTAILPRAPRVSGLELATAMVPATEVGGDYFDILPCDEGCWIGIGDVAGHGLSAGLVMLMIQSIVAATVHERPELGPGQAWKALNWVLSDNIRERMCQEEHATLSLDPLRDIGAVHLRRRPRGSARLQAHDRPLRAHLHTGHLGGHRRGGAPGGESRSVSISSSRGTCCCSTPTGSSRPRPRRARTTASIGSSGPSRPMAIWPRHAFARSS